MPLHLSLVHPAHRMVHHMVRPVRLFRGVWPPMLPDSCGCKAGHWCLTDTDNWPSLCAGACVQRQ
jgi:hypothetical protein